MTELFATIYTVAVTIVFLAWLLAKFLLDLAHDGGDITGRSPGAAPHNRRRSLAPRTWQPVSAAHLNHAETLRLIWAPPPEPVKVAPSPVLLYGRPPVEAVAASDLLEAAA